MSQIVPRWEWRTFGLDFGPAESVFAGRAVEATSTSEELYFHHPGSGTIVKIRDGLLDVKVLEGVDPSGLEQWVPVLKEGFPVPRGVVEEMFRRLARDAPALRREGYTQEELLNEVIGPAGDLRVVEVDKNRARYTIDGCMAELSDLTVGGVPIRTIAVESEDREAVLAAVAGLGLGDYLNQNYLRAITILLDDRAVRYAVIDVGTNSVKFHIAERNEAGTWRPLVDRAEITRLGEGQSEDGPIGVEAMERTAGAIAAMVDEARRNRVRAIAAVGTAALRKASNRDQVLDLIQARAGVRVTVLPGEEEGRLAYLAVKTGLGLQTGSVVVFDTGGGSSQFTFGQGDQVIEQFSVPVGAVAYTEEYGLDGLVSTEQLSSARSAIKAALSAIEGRPRPGALVGMGGAITNLTAVSLGLEDYDPDRVQGAVLQRSEVERQVEVYRTTSLPDRRSMVGLQPKRADVILAGACIVATVMGMLGQESLVVSDRGLRHGVLHDRFGP